MALPTLSKLAGAILCAAAIATPAQAGTIGFETDYGMAFGSGDTYNESGYKLTFEAYDLDAVGSAVGSIIDGSDPFACVNMACPIGNDSMYYGAFNDSIISIVSETNRARFKFNSLDASFIGANPDLGSYPAVAGLLRIQGRLATGGWVTQDLWLDRPGPSGFDFGTYNFTNGFQNLELVEALLFGYACNSTGNCQAFQTNQGQFAIDNLNLAEVPEPASAALFGLGMMGLLARARRRQA